METEVFNQLRNREKRTESSFNLVFRSHLWEWETTIVTLPSGKHTKNIKKLYMENHHVSWVNQLFLWPFSIAMLVITRGKKEELKEEINVSRLVVCRV